MKKTFLTILLSAALAMGATAQNSKEFKNAMADAMAGNVEAQCYVGTCYMNGNGVDEDPAEAMKWFRMASDKGDALSQFLLGSLYFKGIGVEQNYKEAARWFRKSATQGNVDSQYQLAVCYVEGI